MVSFYANQEYIATALCINKDKKAMGCKGKCVLNKKLRDAENSSEKQAPLSIKKTVEASPFLIVQVKEIVCALSLETVYSPMPDQQYQFDINKDIFHPPTSFLSLSISPSVL